jgi:ABC-type polysaccharide/polyol phosphate transport system ATPase subunit
MNPQNAIEVRNMSKQFKIEYDRGNTLKEKLIRRRNKTEYHQVLKNINLDIKKGETVALIGTNGSGKSTLLKLMTKIIFPNEGTIETDGKLTSLLELGAGFHPDFTGRENIYFNASIFGLSRKEIEKRLPDIIAFAELGEFIDNPVRTYSSGMYMRLAFSVAINVDADILLIDEILAVGDQHFQEKCYSKLRQLRDSGKTIVIVTHSLDVVKDMCHRAIWIYKGQVQLDGDPAYVIDEYLKQIAKDNKEEIKKAIESGEQQKQGVVFIDVPKDYMEFYPEDREVECQGWAIANVDDATLHFYVDDEEIHPEVTHRERKDVYEVYFEQYSGFLDVDQLGWRISIPMRSLSKGNHTLRVENHEPDGSVLGEKDVVFIVR